MIRLVFLIVLMAIPACKPHETWRQKPTRVVETPTGEVTGGAAVGFSGWMKVQWQVSDVHMSF